MMMMLLMTLLVIPEQCLFTFVFLFKLFDTSYPVLSEDLLNFFSSKKKTIEKRKVKIHL